MPLLAAWLLLALGMAIVTRLERRLAVRVAVVGSPELGAALGEELELLGLHRWRLVGWVDFTDDGLPCPPGARRCSASPHQWGRSWPSTTST